MAQINLRKMSSEFKNRILLSEKSLPHPHYIQSIIAVKLVALSHYVTMFFLDPDKAHGGI